MHQKDKHSSKKTSSPLMGRYTRGFSPLMIRVMLVNLLAVVTLAGGVLYVNQFRDELLIRRIENLQVQAGIIAAAIGESAEDDTDLDPSEARPIIARLVGPTKMRAMLFSTEGRVMIDSRFLSGDKRVIVEKLPDPRQQKSMIRSIEDSLYSAIDYFAESRQLPIQEDRPGLSANDLIEVQQALDGADHTELRRGEDGTILVNIALPIQRFRRILGALRITAQTDDIEEIVRGEQLAIIRVFLYAFAVTLMISFFLGRTLAAPIRTLAKAAVRVRRGIGREETLPEFSNRRDEIGDLSRALSDMTRALYNQIDAVERFAADVAHELKNPLTSMRSALETFKMTDKKEHKDRLLAILEDDVYRLDRLIGDISDASRLDAELTRAKMDTVDLGKLLTTLVSAYRETACVDGPRLIMDAIPEGEFMVQGIEARLGQVWRNLIDNAITFTPKSKSITVTLRQNNKVVTVCVIDEGAGLSKGSEDKIFKRFYSERPEQDNPDDFAGVAGHSGLGLAISKQVVEAHLGTIHASNRKDGEAVIGAMFEVRLPTAQ